MHGKSSWLVVRTTTRGRQHAHSIFLRDTGLGSIRPNGPLALALGFFVAYLTEDVMTVHVWTGYVVGVLVLARIVWGFLGPRHAPSA